MAWASSMGRSAAFLAAGAAFKKVYSALKQNRSSAGMDVELHNFKDFSQMMGFDWVTDFDAAHTGAVNNK